MRDSFGRRFSYLRLSVTDVCNFRCTYCLPEGFQKCHEDSDLELNEIRRLALGFSTLGFTKVRLTGGEPTTRRDIVEIVEAVHLISGIDKVAMTTNGFRLKPLAKPLFQSGLKSINVSIDSLIPQNFKMITGHDKLKVILDGVDEAIRVGFSSVKINAVLLKDLNHNEIDGFLGWLRDKPITVRWIELMGTGTNAEYFRKHHLSSDFILKVLKERGWSQVPREHNSGPAIEFTHPDCVGRVGVIAPYAKDFCVTCNRLRVSSRGGLRLCLFGEKDYNLRPLLQSDEQTFELAEAVQKLILKKSETHSLHEGQTGINRNFSGIGG